MRKAACQISTPVMYMVVTVRTGSSVQLSFHSTVLELLNVWCLHDGWCRLLPWYCIMEFWLDDLVVRGPALKRQPELPCIPGHLSEVELPLTTKSLALRGYQDSSPARQASIHSIRVADRGLCLIHTSRAQMEQLYHISNVSTAIYPAVHYCVLTRTLTTHG